MARSCIQGNNVQTGSVPSSTKTNFTIAGWLLSSDVTTGNPTITTGNLSNSGMGIYIANGGNINAIEWNGAFAITGPVSTVGVWYHVALTRDTTTATLWVNGASQGTDTGTPTNNPSGFFRIGSGSGSFSGTRSFADAAYWTAVLTQAELTALSKGARPNTIRPASLTLWLPLDGLQSPEPDLSGNANNGTLTGTASAFGPPIAPFTPRWPNIPQVFAPPFTLMPQIVT
jgi:hypothetical protein